MASLDERITTFSRDGLRFDVTDEGPLGGDVVVLLHGFPTDRTSWDRVAARLHEAGLRTLAPDQRGYSPGARPSDRDAYRLDELVADVLALIDASGRERVHLVGHDWGGALAWLVAGNHPTRIASLTVLSTPAPGRHVAGLEDRHRARSGSPGTWPPSRCRGCPSAPWPPRFHSPPDPQRACRRRTGGGMPSGWPTPTRSPGRSTGTGRPGTRVSGRTASRCRRPTSGARATRSSAAPPPS